MINYAIIIIRGMGQMPVWFDRHVNNGVIEDVNSKISGINKVAYEHHSLDKFVFICMQVQKSSCRILSIRYTPFHHDDGRSVDSSILQSCIAWCSLYMM